MSNSKNAAASANADAAATTTKSEPTLTGEEVAELREQGMTWKEIAEQAGLPNGASIIPLRNAMYKAQGKTTKARNKKAQGQEVVKMRDAGHGWPKIAAAMGLSVADARKLYTESGGANPDGRVYVRQPKADSDAPTVTVRTEATQAKPEAEQPEQQA